MGAVEFRLPDIGEGLAEVEVVRWLVGVGDAVEENQPIADVESDKAVVTMPSPASGRVSRLCVGEGERVKVGSLLMVVDVADGAAAAAAAPPAATAPTSVPTGAKGIPPVPARSPKAPQDQSAASVLASPAVRRFAAKLHVPLEAVAASGPRGRVTAEDVETYARGRQDAPGRTEMPSSPATAVEVEAVPFRGVRRRIAEALVHSARTIPHVSGFHEFDATALVRLHRVLRPRAEQAGVHLTFLPFVIKAAVQALRAHRSMNASLDEDAQVILLKKFYNIGIAAATDEGLVVPVIRHADRLDLIGLAREAERLARLARERRLVPGDQQNGTFTITNVGNQRGWLNTSIIRHPEVAILGVGRIEERPVVRNGQIVAAPVMPLALTFDHRVVDGDTGLGFMLTLREYLEQPERLLLGESAW